MAKIKGTYLFNEVISNPPLQENVNFTIPGLNLTAAIKDGRFTHFTSGLLVGTTNSELDLFYFYIPLNSSQYAAQLAYDGETKTWNSIAGVSLRLVDFGKVEQDVSDEFDAWFNANAKKVTVLTTLTIYYSDVDMAETVYKVPLGMTFAELVTSEYNVDGVFSLDGTGDVKDVYYKGLPLIGKSTSDPTTTITSKVIANNVDGIRYVSGIAYPTATFDLSTLNLSAGTHSITVKAKASGYTDSVESNAVSYTVLAENAFTVDGVTYYADEGMTWEAWLHSEYNTDGWTMLATGSVYYVYLGSSLVLCESSGARVLVGDTIIMRHHYRKVSL